MIVIHFGLYIALMGLLNHIRGGYLNKLWQATVFWKVFSAASVGLLSWVVLGLPMIPGLALGGLWYAMMLPPWATWFDMGQLPVESRKIQNQYLLNVPWSWVQAHVTSPRTQDQIMMTLRGLCSLAIFGPIAWYRGEPLIALLTLPCAVLWMMGYDVDRNYIKLNWSEYLSGAVIGLFIVLAVAL